MIEATKTDGEIQLTQELIVKMVAILFEAFGRKVSDATFDAYLIGLRGVPAEALKEAFETVLRTRRFMPSPSEIRAAAGYGEDDTERATLAWQQVRAAISRYDAYMPVRFDDPRTNAAIRAIGGWVALCDATTDELKWKEKEFIRHYVAMRCLTLSSEQTAPLPGLFDTTPKSLKVTSLNVPNDVRSLPHLTILPTTDTVSLR